MLVRLVMMTLTSRKSKERIGEVGAQAPAKPTRQMTKKDYIAIAKVLSEVAPDLDSEQFAYLVQKLGEIFKADNSLFDRVRFHEAIFGKN
jgi:hypothetical protein